MTVYVDMLIDYGWRLGPSCHMTADSLDELHAFAARLGLKRSYAQLPPRHYPPHYDLVRSKRQMAVRLGAIEIDHEHFLEHMKRLRMLYPRPASEITP